MKGVFSILLCLTTACAIGIARQWPGYKVRQRYTYGYKGLVIHAVPRFSEKGVGLSISADCHLDIIKENVFQLKLENIKAEKCEIKMNAKGRPVIHDTSRVEIPTQYKDQLELPVQLYLNHRGAVKTINARRQDSTFSLNIKRGLANLLHLAPKQQAGQNHIAQEYERTAVGDCEVTYNIPDPGERAQPHTVSMFINYDKCKNRVQLKQTSLEGKRCHNCEGSPRYLRSLGHIDYTLANDNYTKKFIIKQAASEETHVLTPFSEVEGEASGYASQDLTFKDDKKSSAKEMAMEHQTGLRFEVQDPEGQRRRDKNEQATLEARIKKQIQQVKSFIQDRVDPKAARHFTELVQNIRRCNLQNAQKVAKHILQQKDRIVRKLCIDAWAMAGTQEAVQALKEKAIAGKLTGREMYRVFFVLPFTPYLSIKISDAALALCKHENVKKDRYAQRNCLMAFGALVRRICNSRAMLQKPETISAVREYRQFLGKQLNRAKTPEEQITYLNAIGNAGLKSLRGYVYKILTKRDAPLNVRVECARALARIAPQMPLEARAKLLPIFADATEHPELRMTVFTLLLDCDPSLVTLQAVADTVRREMYSSGRRSNQVASYVKSHLHALANQQDIITRQRSSRARLALRFLPAITLGLDYSRGIRAAMYSREWKVFIADDCERSALNWIKMLLSEMNGNLGTSLPRRGWVKHLG